MSDTVDSTALRVALWRALHRLVDAPPWILDDELAMQIAAVDDSWRKRPDMHVARTRRARASIVGRARFVEDHVRAQVAAGVRQYVALGAGLDTFALRSPLLGTGLSVFEVDQPGTQNWKARRLAALRIAPPKGLHQVSVDFEAGQSWWEQLVAAGYDQSKPAVFSSLGVAMYLTEASVVAMLRLIAGSATGSSLALSFMRPLHEIDIEERSGRESTERYASAAGTPFLSFFSPEQISSLACSLGFARANHVSTTELERLYFSGRTDGLRPSSSEELIVARV